MESSTTRAYYNEFDPFAAQWLRNLIAAGHIAPGDVDERDIRDVKPDDLKPYSQCHFFAGIGVWSCALRRAGWPDDRAVWTGSCPCQPFSAAGGRAGFDDERHLWPALHWLISKHRPVVFFGEQVASKDGLAWLDLVQADLEGTGYACGQIDLCAAGVGAPHIRQRAWIVAHHHRSGDARRRRGEPSDDSAVRGVGESDRAGCVEGRPASAPVGQGSATDATSTAGYGGPVNGIWRDADWIFCRDGKWRPVEPGTFPLAHGAPARVGRLRGYGNAIVAQAAEEVIRAYMDTAP